MAEATLDPSQPVSILGGKTASPLGQFGWLAYELAQGPYFLLINIFVFGPYFSSIVIGDPVIGQSYWGYIQGTAGLVIAMLSPILGSLADATGARKIGISIFVTIAGFATLGLWFASPAMPELLPLVILSLIVSAVMLEFASVYHNAMLPSLVSHKSVGKLSGLGYSSQYVAGSAVFLIWLFFFSLPDTPLFGLSKETYGPDRIVGPLTAVWLGIFILPLFLFTPDLPRSDLSVTKAARVGLERLYETFKSLSHYRNIAIYLVARLIYYDGMTAVFAFIGIYAAGIFGWTTAQVGIFALITLNISAVGGAIGGWLDDKIGSKKTILIAVAGFGLTNLVSISITPDVLFFFWSPESVAWTQMPVLGGFMSSLGFETFAEQLFISVAMFGGVFAGPGLASSRTMLARIVPPSMAGEFYGLYTLTGKATAFIAPFAIAIATAAFQSQRAGFSIVLVFLVVGFTLMFFVKEEQSVEAH